MKSKTFTFAMGGALLWGAVLCFAPALAGAQTALELSAGMAISDDLNSQSVAPSGAGIRGLNQARDLAGQREPSPDDFGDPPADQFTPPPGGEQFVAPFNAVGDVAGQVANVIEEPKITVIVGSRVFDAVTGMLLDDAVEKQVPESQKDQFYDDGSHGDVERADGTYTLVDELREYLGQSNQRIKEQLVMALYNADDMTPLEFFGFSLMSTDNRDHVSRNRAWKLVPSPDGGPGMVLAEVPIDRPVEVPKFREKRTEKDNRVRDDWSYRFLQEYRQNKDSLTSEFYPLYVPVPPQTPSVAPPAGWAPFAGAGLPQPKKPGEGLADLLGGMGGMGDMGGMSVPGGF